MLDKTFDAFDCAMNALSRQHKGIAPSAPSAKAHGPISAGDPCQQNVAAAAETIGHREAEKARQQNGLTSENAPVASFSQDDGIRKAKEVPQQSRQKCRLIRTPFYPMLNVP